MNQYYHKLVVSGRVQGVGFRANAKRVADALNMTGYAKNLPDHTVEIIIKDEMSRIELFIKKLKNAQGEHLIKSITHLTIPERPLSAEFEIL